MPSYLSATDHRPCRVSLNWSCAHNWRPSKFFDTLRVLGADIVESREYADHHAYTASEIARLKARARCTEAKLVTTEKDYVRLTTQDRDGVRFLPVRAAFTDQTAFERLLDRVAAAR